jgi:hypothetical protein
MNLHGIATDLTILYIALFTHIRIQKHRDMLPTVRTSKEVFYHDNPKCGSSAREPSAEGNLALA